VVAPTIASPRAMVPEYVVPAPVVAAPRVGGGSTTAPVVQAPVAQQAYPVVQAPVLGGVASGPSSFGTVTSADGGGSIKAGIVPRQASSMFIDQRQVMDQIPTFTVPNAANIAAAEIAGRGFTGTAPAGMIANASSGYFVPPPAAAMAAAIPSPAVVTPAMIGSSFPAQMPAGAGRPPSPTRARDVYAQMTGRIA